jgi:hypothetical protein
MKQAVIGLIPTPSQADALIVTLRARGIKGADISFRMHDFVRLRGSISIIETKAPEFIRGGAAIGLLFGSVIGWLAGAGFISVPVIGSLTAAGPALAALTGAFAGGAIGGLVGAPIGLALPTVEPRQNPSRQNDGSVLVEVRTDDTDIAQSIEQILKAGGAQEVTCTKDEHLIDSIK